MLLLPHGCVGKRAEDTNGSTFIPINTHVQVERFDLFVVLALGELVAGADVKGVVDDDHVTIKIVLAILTGLGIKFLAFDYAEHPTVSLHKSIDKRGRVQHALTASPTRRISFTLSHIPLLLGVLLVASILEDHIMHDGLMMQLKRCIYGIGCFYFVFHYHHSNASPRKERRQSPNSKTRSHIGEIDYFIHYATGTIFSYLVHR